MPVATGGKGAGGNKPPLPLSPPHPLTLPPLPKALPLPSDPEGALPLTRIAVSAVVAARTIVVAPTAAVRWAAADVVGFVGSAD